MKWLEKFRILIILFWPLNIVESHQDTKSSVWFLPLNRVIIASVLFLSSKGLKQSRNGKFTCCFKSFWSCENSLGCHWGSMYWPHWEWGVLHPSVLPPMSQAWCLCSVEECTFCMLGSSTTEPHLPLVLQFQQRVKCVCMKCLHLSR